MFLGASRGRNRTRLTPWWWTMQAIFTISSLLYFLLHLTALILSLVFWRRYPKVCLLVLIGSLLNLTALAARTVLPMIWLFRFEERVGFALMNLALSFVNIFGSALYLVAVFAERSDDRPRRPYWPPRDNELADGRTKDDDWR